MPRGMSFNRYFLDAFLVTASVKGGVEEFLDDIYGSHGIDETRGKNKDVGVIVPACQFG